MDSNPPDVRFGHDLSLPRLRFKPLSTRPVAIFQSLLFVLFGILNYLINNGKLKEYELLKSHPCDSLVLILYCQAALFLVSMIVDHYYKWRHKFVERNGYFDQFKMFNRNTNLIIGAVLLLNAILIVLFAAYFQSQDEDSKICTDERIQSPLNVFSILMMVESFICSILLLLYSWRVKQFNAKKPLTMFDSEDRMLLIGPPGSNNEIGYRDTNEGMVDLLDKYVYTINHLVAYNRELLNQMREPSA